MYTDAAEMLVPPDETIQKLRDALTAAMEIPEPKAEELLEYHAALSDPSRHVEPRLRTLHACISAVPSLAQLLNSWVIIDNVRCGQMPAAPTAIWLWRYALRLRAADEPIDRLLALAASSRVRLNSALVAGGVGLSETYWFDNDLCVYPWHVAIQHEGWMSRIATVMDEWAFIAACRPTALWTYEPEVPLRFEPVQPADGSSLTNSGREFYERHFELPTSLGVISKTGPVTPIFYFLTLAIASPPIVGPMSLPFARYAAPVYSATSAELDDLNAAIREASSVLSGLDPKARKKLLTPVQRLNKAMAAGSASDTAIEMRIALETTFAESDETGEIGYRVRTRVGRYLGGGFEDRKTRSQAINKAYHEFSKAVHTGELTQSSKFHEHVLAALNATSAGLRKMFKEGGRPDWKDFDLR